MSDPLPIPGPLRLGDLLDRAFRLYRARFWLMILTMAILLGPLAIISGVLIGGLFTNIFDLANNTGVRPRGSEAQQLAQMIGGLGLIALVLLLLGLSEGLASMAVIYHGDRLLHRLPTSLGDGLRYAAGRLLAYIGMQLLRLLVIGGSFGLLMGGVAAMAVGLGVASASGSSTNQALVGLFVFGIIMLVLLIVLIGMIYLSARWLTSEIGLVVERWGPVTALRRSWELSRGQVWRSIGYALVLYLLAQFIIGLPLQFIQQIAILSFGPEALGIVTGFSYALAYIARIFWVPLQALAQLLLYYDFRVRAEGYDLALRVQRLEAGLAPPPAPPASGLTPEGERQ